MAERGIPHNPGSYAAYVGCWVAVLRENKHELFRAARDAHKAARLLIALEYHKSLDHALTYVNNTHLSIDQTDGAIAKNLRTRTEFEKPAIEIEL